METPNLTCPDCGGPIQNVDMVWTCDAHGTWMLYGKQLLVRVPTQERLRHERVALPWETQPSSEGR